MDILECSICYDGLNDSTRRPRCLPWGHTICTLCIDKSIEKGDRTCPSCRQPHNVTAAGKLPINFYLEEMFQKLTVKTSENRRVSDGNDVKANKEKIMSESRNFIYSFESTVLELQNELRMKENLLVTHTDQLAQKLAEVECLKKDIQEVNEAKEGIEGNITELEEKIRFLEISVQNIRTSKSNTDIQTMYEDVKKKLKISGLSHDDAKTNVITNESQPSEDDFQIRTLRLLKAEGGLGFTILGGSEFNLPICITRINPGTAAHSHGGFKPGDCIITVNGEIMEGKTQTAATELLRSTTGEVTLEVKHTPGMLEQARKKYRDLGYSMEF
ncbi:unnamed protein product, partial [Meganyctiphanes norvegica]